jgi:DNA-binding transcriptional LysR family regulator
MVVIDDTFSDPHLHAKALCPEPLTLLARPDHPLATRPKLTPQDLCDQAFLLTDIGCAYRSKLERGARAGTGETKGHYGIHERGNHQAVRSIGNGNRLSPGDRRAIRNCRAKIGVIVLAAVLLDDADPHRMA